MGKKRKNSYITDVYLSRCDVTASNTTGRKSDVSYVKRRIGYILKKHLDIWEKRNNVMVCIGMN